MELLLNLIWLTLATGTLLAFVCRRRGFGSMMQVSCRKSLLALACVVVLLFPIVSASDDLHPVQAVAEEATKRIQFAVVPFHSARTSAPPFMLPAMLVVCLMPALVLLRRVESPAPKTRVLGRSVAAFAGRAPPSAWS
jgi:hypothetical protein